MDRWVQWSAKQPVKIVWASLTPSLDVARQDCLLHRFFSYVSKSSDKHVEFKRKVTFKSFLYCYILNSTLSTTGDSLLSYGWKYLCCNSIFQYF